MKLKAQTQVTNRNTNRKLKSKINKYFSNFTTYCDFPLLHPHPHNLSAQSIYTKPKGGMHGFGASLIKVPLRTHPRQHRTPSIRIVWACDPRKDSSSGRLSCWQDLQASMRPFLQILMGFGQTTDCRVVPALAGLSRGQAQLGLLQNWILLIQHLACSTLSTLIQIFQL